MLRSSFRLRINGDREEGGGGGGWQKIGMNRSLAFDEAALSCELTLSQRRAKRLVELTTCPAWKLSSFYFSCVIVQFFFSSRLLRVLASVKPNPPHLSQERWDLPLPGRKFLVVLLTSPPTPTIAPCVFRFSFLTLGVFSLPFQSSFRLVVRSLSSRHVHSRHFDFF